jgi:uncharacterized peroxidase-related enzyme
MDELMWVDYVEDEEASGELKEFYDRVRTPDGHVGGIYKVLSLRPQVAIAKQNLRVALLGEASSLGPKLSDMISTVISGLNDCRFCGTAHGGMMVRRGDVDLDQATKLYLDWQSADLTDQERTMLTFCEKLNFNPSATTQEDLQTLRDAGFTDENIVDIVAHVAYRNFIGRIHDALGLAIEGERPMLEAVGGPKPGTNQIRRQAEAPQAAR